MHLRNGIEKNVRNLVVGDEVYVGRGLYSTIFMFTHQDAKFQTKFVALTVAANLTLTVTPSHFIYAASGPVSAGSVKAGDLLRLGDGSTSAVTKIREFVDVGVFNPQTEHGDIVVEGVLSSTYTAFMDGQMAHAMLTPLRALYRSFGLHLSSLF